MAFSRENFGVAQDGRPVELFSLRDRNGLAVRFTNYGCRVVGLLCNGANVALGFDDLQRYLTDDACHGAFVGRYANRIKNAAFSLGGKKYQLTKNDGENFLHGSLQHKIFSVKETTEKSVVFAHVSPAGTDGFPGNLAMEVTYIIEGNHFTMQYRAETDAPTHVNFTNHTYFNLSAGEEKTVENHLLRLASDSFLEIGADLCPTGKILDARGTAFDFTKEKRIGKDIREKNPQLLLANGYDHCFLLNGRERETPVFAAELRDPQAKRALRVYTTQPAMQLYTGNFLKEKRASLCLETQHYPDSPNHPEFPGTLLRPGEIYNEATVWEFIVTRNASTCE